MKKIDILTTFFSSSQPRIIRTVSALGVGVSSFVSYLLFSNRPVVFVVALCTMSLSFHALGVWLYTRRVPGEEALARGIEIAFTGMAGVFVIFVAYLAFVDSSLALLPEAFAVISVALAWWSLGTRFVLLAVSLQFLLLVASFQIFLHTRYLDEVVWTIVCGFALGSSLGHYATLKRLTQ